MAATQKSFETAVSEEPVVDRESKPSVTMAGYEIKPLTMEHLQELMRLSIRCFRGSESYNQKTFEYLLREPQALAYRAVTSSGKIVGFLFVLGTGRSIAHITTVAVAPEHRKQGLAQHLLCFAERVLIAKDVESIVLEVRASNCAAQNLYAERGFVIIQKLVRYYSDGEDAFLMSKAIAR